MNRAAQLRSAQRSYDNASPVEPVDYDYTDADIELAASIVKADEVAELVMEVRESAGLLSWVSHEGKIPLRYLKAFRALIARAEDFDRRARDFAKRSDAILERES